MQSHRNSTGHTQLATLTAMDYLVKNLRFLGRHPSLNGSQTAAGESAGIGQPAISKIINGGTKEPGFRTVMRLARYYGVSVDDLISRDIETHGASTPSQPPRLDVGKLASLIETVEAAAQKSSMALDASFRARVVAALYVNSGEEHLTAQAVQAALYAVMSSLEEP